jgi:hypothetical protein
VPGTGTVTFKYDPFGRRVQKRSGTGIANYLDDGANLIEESPLDLWITAGAESSVFSR